MKKFTTRFLTVFLAMAILIASLPMSIFAAELKELLQDGGEVLSGEEVSQEGTSESSAEVYALGEDTALRTAKTKQIRMSDGSYYAAMYASAVHFLNSNGEWEEIDNTLVASNARAADDFNGVETKNAGINVKFANNSNSSKLVAIKTDDYEISFGLVGAHSTKGVTVNNPEPHAEDASALDRIIQVKKAVSSVVYHDILENTDLEYVVSGSGVKENIIVKEKADSYVYEFDMKLNKLTAETAPDGTIVLKDEKSGEVMFTLDLPFMYDANGASSNAVAYSLEKIKNKEYRITVTADSAWMSDESRAYPVTIDPPIFFGGSDVEDTCVYEGTPDVVYGSNQVLAIGYEQGKAWYSYWKFNTPISIPENSIIIEAALELPIISLEGSEVYVGAYEQTGAWSEASLTWRNKGSIGSLVDYFRVDSSMVVGEQKAASWDLTALAQKWHKNGTNNGIVLMPLDNVSYGTSAVVLASSEAWMLPIFYVSYRNIVGLESQYTYQTQSVGRAGTGNINLYNSNLTLVRDILSSASEIMPFSLSHVYNSANAGLEFTNNENEGIHTVDFSKMKVGKGWKLSAQETVVKKTFNDYESYVYNDADGTEHYFIRKDGKWVDEDGLNLTLTISSTQYTITDKSDNRKIFTNGILTQIVDANGNKIEFIYNSNNQLTSITRLNVEGVAETLATFTYNSSYYLTSVTDAYGRVTNINYNASKFVTTVIAPDGQKANYAYTTSGKMKEAYDSEANYGVLYNVVVVADIGETITTVQEFYKNDSLAKISGNKFDIELNPGFRSSCIDYGADGSLGTADDIVTTYRFDRMGRTVTAYSTDEDRMFVYGASSVGYTAETGAAANRVSVAAVTGIMPKNYVKNGSMEQSDAWTLGYGSYVDTYGHTGTRSVKLNNVSTTRYVSQTVSLPDSAVFTASAYVDVSALDGDVFIEVMDTYDGMTWSGEMLSRDLLTSSDDSWQRITCTFAPEYGWGGDFQISVKSTGSGVVYVDDVQVEEFVAPSNYNLIGDLSLWTMANAWSRLSTYNTSYGSVPSINMTGSPSLEIYATTTVPINRPSDTAFMFSVWASGNSIPTGDFALHATINYTDSSTETTDAPFQKGISIGEQFLTAMIVPKQTDKTIASITLKLSFSNTSGGMHFYNLALVEEAARTYNYDEEGNLTAANQSDSESISSSYDDLDNLISQKQGEEEYEYTYKAEGNKHLVETVTSDGVTMAFTYDKAGNVTGTVITAMGTSSNMSSGSTYSTDKNFVLSSTDTSNNTTYFGYNSNDLLSYTKNAKGTYVYYEYNGQNDRQTKAYINNVVSASYAYTKGALSTITRKDESSSSGKTQTYSFTYDDFGNVTEVKVGELVLVQYEYAPNNGNLIKTTYGDGEDDNDTVIENVYDVLDRIVQIKYNGHIRYRYSYNGNGDLCEIEDIDNSTKYRYEYDSLDRPCASYTIIDDTVRIVSDYTYDGKSRVTAYTCGMAGATGGSLGQTYGYTYDDESGTMSSMTVTASGVSDTMSFTYDALQRLTAKNTVRTGLTLAQEYSYKNLSGNRTTTQISGLTQKINGSTTDSYTYTYDSLGNITAINRNGYAPISYTYDAQGQLIKVVEGDFRYEYTYDTYGNILSVKYVDDYSDEVLSENEYVYEASGWIDRLIEFNDVKFDYDEIGNPTKYYNGSLYNFSWDGRELATAVKGSTSVSYKYGADGLRTEKKVGSTTYNYYYADGLLVRQTWGTNNYIDFLYDESSSAYSFIYNGTQYYYVRNLQGDVVKILNTSGGVVASYTYDAWGKVTSSGNVVGQYNPIRYRGYYYDTDTGFYYLQSRYYDPVVKRFISADDASLIGANGDFISLNLYAYCLNNPIDRIDSNGEFSWETMFYVGVSVLAIGVGLLAAIPTGGGSLVLAGAGITAAAATTAASTVAATGIAIAAGSLVGAGVENSGFNFRKQSKKSGKERSTDKPSWVDKGDVDYSQTAHQNKNRIMDEKFGPGNWDANTADGAASQIHKWLTRHIGLK